jgi:hypothetical protein
MIAMSSHDEGQERRGGTVYVSAEVVARRLEDEIVLVHLQTNRIYTLSATAARFWELLQGGLEHADIVRILRQEYEVDGAQLEAEIAALVTRLSAEGLISRHEPT